MNADHAVGALLRWRARLPGGYTVWVQGDIDKVLISRDRIDARIRELGAQICRDLDDLSRTSGHGDIVLVPILTGSIIFVADLMRQLPHKVRISLIAASSYPGRSTSSVGVTLASALPEDLTGQHVLIVDDILDSGNTIRTIRTLIASRHPKSVRACVLLRKTVPAALETPCEYVGFDIPDVFVVGCGLDFDNYYRNLPDIVTLKKEVVD